MQCRWQVEIDPWCRRVLAKQWPDVRRWDDVRTWPQPDTEPVDLICGGFPCQDISNAGKRKGITGERSGLWKEFARILGVVRPGYALIENVSAILGRGLDTVLCDLAAIGFDAEWHCIPAAACGFFHLRKRIFVVAYPNSQGRESVLGNFKAVCKNTIRKEVRNVRSEFALESYRCLIERLGYDIRRPGISGKIDGIPHRVDRLTGLGNAVVPQVAELIGRMILEQEATHDSRHR